MGHRLKVAIFSGVIPSSTFIERLINGLALSDDIEVQMFGMLQSKTQYGKQIKVFGYRNNKWSKLILLLKYTVLLTLFKRKAKNKLDQLLKSENRLTLLNRLKFYPVLWHQPHIFHLQWAKGLKDWIWVRDFDMKLVLSLRGTQINQSPVADKELANDYKSLFPHVDAFHSVSKDIAEQAQKYAAKKENIKVIYSGIEPMTLQKSQKKESNVLKIISVGRPHWVKGYTYALDACKLLKDKSFNFEYTIIGASKNIELAYQIQDLGLQDCVKLFDTMPFEKVQQAICNSDLFLLPSLNEGLANVVLESMMHKTLVLTTDCGGMSEVVSESINGFIVPIRDSKAMSEKILEISILSEAERKKLTENAFTTVREQHNTKQMINGMLQLYKELHDAK
ncbi:glycosyltransferase family 4 protein [Psychroserpens sp. XS_ASV72]|uniref:glycosyltransferase family 4 protein n=1 Tax=Psychroserpens sp. XS_ASV72 TaxID=3241293 RepID=UPI003513716C